MIPLCQNIATDLLFLSELCSMCLIKKSRPMSAFICLHWFSLWSTLPGLDSCLPAAHTFCGIYCLCFPLSVSPRPNCILYLLHPRIICSSLYYIRYGFYNVVDIIGKKAITEVPRIFKLPWKTKKTYHRFLLSAVNEPSLLKSMQEDEGLVLWCHLDK